MATLSPHHGPVGPDTLITVKVIYEGQNRRFKLALRDLGAHTLPQKVRCLVTIHSTSCSSLIIYHLGNSKSVLTNQ
jgi:hypothetical protein